jgi:hypothetical protein
VHYHMCFFFNPGPVWRVPIQNRYTAKAKLCFCKNNKRRIISNKHTHSREAKARTMSTHILVANDNGGGTEACEGHALGAWDGAGTGVTARPADQQAALQQRAERSRRGSKNTTPGPARGANCEPICSLSSCCRSRHGWESFR